MLSLKGTLDLKENYKGTDMDGVNIDKNFLFISQSSIDVF